jgi:hypothetical protein
MLINFFNDNTVLELLAVPGCVFGGSCEVEEEEEKKVT